METKIFRSIFGQGISASLRSSGRSKHRDAVIVRERHFELPMATRTVLRFLCILIVLACVSAAAAASSTPANPADQLFDILNQNRTAHKSPSLVDNSGLGCIALQYIKAYEGECEYVGGTKAKRPPQTSFAETFAPNCGVEVPSLGQISGRLLGCQSKYVPPAKAFSQILMKNNESLSILYSKNHSQAGVAIQGTDGGGPYFWCVLFSSADPKTSFKLEGAAPLKQSIGCYSGTNDTCNTGTSLSSPTWAYHLCLLLGSFYLIYALT